MQVITRRKEARLAAIDTHPTVRAHRAAHGAAPRATSGPVTLDAADLRRLCLDAGADDVGFVALARPELDDQRDSIAAFWPRTRTLISIVKRMHPEPVRNPARSVANLEFHTVSDDTSHTARMIVAKLALRGVAAINPPSGFPMEMATFPGKVWAVSHKPVAVAAGLGQMGIHRNVIHPKFGSFVLLATVLIDADVTAQSTPVDYNPCLECKLCIAACPVGAISEDGFNFAACYTHNYREFMGGFTDWVERIVDAKDARAYRANVDDAETVSMWQSLAFGPNYKAAYCLAVCPAGEDVIGPFLENKPAFVQALVKPLQQKQENIYVTKGSDAERHVRKRYPHKRIRYAKGVLRPTSIRGFIDGSIHVFQPGAAQGLDEVYHFTFTGREPATCTFIIRNQRIEVRPGHEGTPTLAVTADASAWLKAIRGDAPMPWLILRGKVRLRGPIKKLIAFGKCFPG